MEALTDDIVFSLSAYLRPRDLANLALTSRRFGGRAGGSIKCAADGGRKWSLLEDVARRLVEGDEGHANLSRESLERQGGESWMAVLHRLHEQQIIEEAVAAAPALFAKPGEIFSTTDFCNSYYSGQSRVKYVGRNELDWPDGSYRARGGRAPRRYRRPKKGWLIFHNTGEYQDRSIKDGRIRNTADAWPKETYSQYDESGKRIEHTLCIPPEKCGALELPEEYDNNANLVPPRDIKERVREILVTTAMIQEAKRAMPVLVAKPGDLFEWKGVVVIYMGRNEVSPISVDIGGTATGPHMVDTPPIGWLLFHNHDKSCNSIDANHGSIRDGIGAFPIDVYSHYDESGKRVVGTLCVPPEKCGALIAYVEPVYEELMREEFRVG